MVPPAPKEPQPLLAGCEDPIGTATPVLPSGPKVRLLSLTSFALPLPRMKPGAHGLRESSCSASAASHPTGPQNRAHMKPKDFGTRLPGFTCWALPFPASLLPPWWPQPPLPDRMHPVAPQPHRMTHWSLLRLPHGVWTCARVRAGRRSSRRYSAPLGGPARAVPVPLVTPHAAHLKHPSLWHRARLTKQKHLLLSMIFRNRLMAFRAL